MGKISPVIEKEPNMPTFGEKLAETFKINPKLVSLKFLMLLLYGGMAALYPYLTVHMKSVGLTLTESGVIYALLPIVSCIGPPIGGALADRIGNYKLILIVVNLLSIVFHLLILFAVPSALPTVTTTESQISVLNVSFSCTTNRPVIFLEQTFSNQTCGVRNIRWPDAFKKELRFLDCATDCSTEPGFMPEVCFGHHTNCSYYSDMSNRSLTDVGLSRVNNSWTMKNFTTDDGEHMTKIGCMARLTRSSGDCSVTCVLLTDFLETCETSQPPANRVITFALYTTFRLLATLFVFTLIPLLDAAAYQMSEEHDGDLGFQRIFSLFGMCVCPPVSGILVGMASKKSGFSDYSPAFYIFGGMHLIAAVISICMSISLRTAAENIGANVGKILRNPKVFVFVFMMFLAGCAWGFLENFLFWFMEEDLASPKWLLGMTNTVSSLAAIPVVASSTFLMKYFGHTKIMMFCFVIYGCRFLSYSIIYDPYHVLPVEILEAFTTSLFTVVSSVYCGKIAPDYLATLQGVVGGLHSAAGRGVGSLAGGLMFQHLKARMTYRIFGTTCVGIGILYAILHYSWLRRVPNPKRDLDAIPGKRETLIPPGVTVEYQLSPEDENALARFSRMDAFTRRYSLAPMMMETVNRKESNSEEARRDFSSARGRRRSTLVPTYMSLGGARN